MKDHPIWLIFNHGMLRVPSGLFISVIIQNVVVPFVIFVKQVHQTLGNSTNRAILNAIN